MLLMMICLTTFWSSGCGTTKQTLATEQVLASEAVDGAISKIDFTPLTGQKVFFDTRYIQDYQGVGFVNSNYVISGLRQQMTAAGLKLQEAVTTADYVIEGRVGTLGTDGHEIVYGIPSSSANSLTAAASAAATISGGAPIPGGIPELSFARRNDRSAAAKVSVYAYERESRERVWQSGSSLAKSTAKDSWFMGIGPFQKGTIYDGKFRFAGEDVIRVEEEQQREGLNGYIASHDKEALFKVLGDNKELQDQQIAQADPPADAKAEGVQQASAEEAAPEEKEKAPPAEKTAEKPPATPAPHPLATPPVARPIPGHGLQKVSAEEPAPETEKPPAAEPAAKEEPPAPAAP